MREDVVQFVWKHQNSVLQNAIECDRQIEIISPGEHNSNSGPDFFNAKVKIDSTLWAGNVEIHINASDWNRHGHQSDPAYDSVILHLVVNNDVQVTNSKGRLVNTVSVPYPNELEQELLNLMKSKAWIPCAEHIRLFDSFSLKMWLSSLAVQRLEEKTKQIQAYVEDFNGSWEEAFYVSMARSFGLKINALPFELMAKATPLKALAKVKDNLHSVEALLFGQAGMLESSQEQPDAYFLALKKEYQYQQKKFNLTPIPLHLWKFLRLRPASFPTIRLSQFAQLIHQSSGLFSRCMEADSLQHLKSLLGVNCSSYWQSHYTFGKESKAKSKVLGNSMVTTIVLNTIVPFIFAYGIYRGNDNLKDRAIDFLDTLKPESNNIVKGFSLLGVNAESAFYTQAMVQLKDHYCNKSKCLYCQVGAKLLLKKAF